MSIRQTKQTTNVRSSVRPYCHEDLMTIIDMLKGEGITADESIFATGVTGVLCLEKEIIGFFTMHLDKNFPHIKHFCIERRHRFNQSNAWTLIRVARWSALMSGYGQMIVHGRGNRMIRFLHAYFRTMPYDQADDGTAFFLVRV